MGVLYAKDSKIYCNEYMEIYIPMSYYEDKLAVNRGSYIETFGVLYTRAFPGGKESPIKLFKVPSIIDITLHEFSNENITVHGKSIAVQTLKFPKDSVIMHQSIPNGREIAELFLSTVLKGKLPSTLRYTDVLDLWWRNLEISGISFKVPSKIYEMIIASVYRNPNNLKERYGQLYGRQANPNAYDYLMVNARTAVKHLSTFSGMTFESINEMITNGINNSLNEIEEPISPLEKIIHYAGKQPPPDTRSEQ